MAKNVTNELLLEHMKTIQNRLIGIAEDVTDIKTDMRGMKGHMISFMQTELSQDSGIASFQARFDRIERRLNLTE